MESMLSVIDKGECCDCKVWEYVAGVSPDIIKVGGINSDSIGYEGDVRDSITIFGSIGLGSKGSFCIDSFHGEDNLINSELIELQGSEVLAVDPVVPSFGSGCGR